MMTCSLEYIVYPRKSIYTQDDYIIGQFKTNASNVPERYRKGIKHGKIDFTAKGVGIPTEKKFDIMLEGKWDNNEKYGLVLTVDKADIALPTDEAGVKLYLTKFLSGCGPITADRIYKRFGSNSLFVLNNEPEKLSEVKGIRPRQLKRMLSDFATTKQYQELALLLGDYNVSRNQIQKISAVLRENAVEKIKENPFILQRFRGFSFDTLDTMSIRFGCDPASTDRLKAAVKAVLRFAMIGSSSLFDDAALQTGGNLFVNQYVVRDVALRLLNYRADSNVNKSQINSVIYKMAADYELRGENGNAYLCENYTHEDKTAQFIIETLLYSNCKKYRAYKIEQLIMRAEKHFGIELSESQNAAVHMVLQNSVSIEGDPLLFERIWRIA